MLMLMLMRNQRTGLCTTSGCYCLLLTVQSSSPAARCVCLSAPTSLAPGNMADTSTSAAAGRGLLSLVDQCHN